MPQVICKCGAEIKNDMITYSDYAKLINMHPLKFIHGIEIIGICLKCTTKYTFKVDNIAYEKRKAKELLIKHINELKSE